MARTLAHPLPLACVAALVVNDHLLKGSGVLPAWVTGKLSDVAGLFFFPVLLVSLARWLAPRRPLPPLLSALATMVVFAAVKTWRPAHALYESVLGPLVMDPTDLIALPCALFAAVWMDGPGRARIRLADRMLVIVAGVASMATSARRLPPCRAPAPEHQRPTIGLAATCMTSPGIRLRREGTRVEGTLVVGSRGGPCALELDHAVLEALVSPTLRLTTRGQVEKTASVVEQGTVTVKVVYTLPTTVPVPCSALKPTFELASQNLEIPVAACEES